MARKANAQTTIKALFARSGNVCAFPGCSHPLIDDDGEYVAQICHIEAANPGGARYRDGMGDDARRAAANLMVMCHRHHKKTDNEDLYTVTVLQQMKAEHEAKYFEKNFVLTDATVKEIYDEEVDYWEEVAEANAKWLAEFNLAMEVPVHSDPTEYLRAISDDIALVEKFIEPIDDFLEKLNDSILTFLKETGVDTSQYEAVSYYNNPFWKPFWETRNLGIANAFNRLRISTRALEVFLKYQKLRAHPNNAELRSELAAAKEDLLTAAKHAGYVD